MTRIEELREKIAESKRDMDIWKEDERTIKSTSLYRLHARAFYDGRMVNLFFEQKEGELRKLRAELSELLGD